MRATNATVTFGLQAKPLPPFDGDALDPRRCGGDLAVLIQAQDEPPQRLEGPEPRWERRGTRHARGALGFQEGTINLRRPMDFDRHVWVRTNDRTGMIGGTYLVVRDIHVDAAWHELTEPEQERIIGRSKASGAPLTGRRLYDKPQLETLAADAHIRVATPRTAGVALHRHTRTVGSATFAIPPGAPRVVHRATTPLTFRTCRSTVTHFSDPGCPWAWSASPALAALKWRYGDQLEWRHVMIGLTEFGSVYEERGYTGPGQARGYRNFRWRGMPFSTEPRERVHGTWPMCRVVVATRRLAPEREYAVFRALQFAQFTTTLFLEDYAQLREAIAWVPGIDADAIIAAAQDPETERLFEADKDEARTAAGSPTEFQNKHANTDGRVRYTAPSLKLDNGTTHPRGGRLPVVRGLRRADRQPGHEPHPPRPRDGRRRGHRRLPGRSHDRRDRADHAPRTSSRRTRTPPRTR